MRATPVWAAICGVVVLTVAPAAARAAEPIEIHLTGLLLFSSAVDGLHVYAPRAEGHDLTIYYDCSSNLPTAGPGACTGHWMPPAGVLDLGTLRIEDGTPGLDLHDPLRPSQLDASCQLDPSAQPRFQLPPNPLSAPSGPIEYSTAYGERDLAEVYVYSGQTAGKPTLNGVPLTSKQGVYRLLVTNTSGSPSAMANRIVLAHMMELAEETLTCEPTWIKIPVSMCCAKATGSCQQCPPAPWATKGSGPVRCPPVWGG